MNRPADRTLNVALCVALVCLVALASSCNPCRTAQKYIAKAAAKCPEVLQQPPADTATGAAEWRPEQVDSILAACAQYKEALASEHAIGTIALKHLLTRDQPLAKEPTVPRPKKKAQEARKQAAAEIRKAVCTIDPVLVNSDELSLHIWFDQSTGKIRYEAECKCDAQVQFEPERPTPLALQVVLWALLIVLVWHLARQTIKGWKESEPQG